MSIGNQIKATAIESFVTLIGHGEIFSRVVAEIQRTNEKMPDNTGEEKRAQFFKDVEIIFTDLVEPVAKSVLGLLLELGVSYLKSKVK